MSRKKTGIDNFIGAHEKPHLATFPQLTLSLGHQAAIHIPIIEISPTLKRRIVAAPDVHPNRDTAPVTNLAPHGIKHFDGWSEKACDSVAMLFHIGRVIPYLTPPWVKQYTHRLTERDRLPGLKRQVHHPVQRPDYCVKHLWQRTAVNASRCPIGLYATPSQIWEQALIAPILKKEAKWFTCLQGIGDDRKIREQPVAQLVSVFSNDYHGLELPSEIVRHAHYFDGGV